MSKLGRDIPIFDPQPFRSLVTIFERPAKYEEAADEKHAVKTELKSLEERVVKGEEDVVLSSNELKHDQSDFQGENYDNGTVLNAMNGEKQDSKTELKRGGLFVDHETVDPKRTKKEE